MALEEREAILADAVRIIDEQLAAQGPLTEQAQKEADEEVSSLS